MKFRFAVRIIPLANCALISAVMALSGCDRSPGTALKNPPREAPDGWEVYTANCLSCHRTDGKGIPNTFPPLAGSEWVTGSSRRLIALTLDGVNDAQTVAGVEYHGVMPAWRTPLSDAQIAAVLTYIRQTWGNSSPPISALEVQQIRTATMSRKTFWTTHELLEMDDTAHRPSN